MLIAFVFIAILLGLAIAFAIAFPYVFRNYYRKNPRKIIGRDLYHIANVKDYYLINVLKLETNGRTNLEVDHLMFGNKYIYLVKDFYAEAYVRGSLQDNSFLVIDKNGHHYADNPLATAKEQVHQLANILNYDESLFVPIAIVNDRCKIENYRENYNLIYRSLLKKTIEYYESQDIDLLDQEKMVFAVHDISCINARKYNE